MIAKEKLAKLVIDIQNGKEKSFDEFYNQTKNIVYHYVRLLIKEQEIIKDIMQETYLSFFENVEKLSVSGNPLAYLITTAKNKAVNKKTKENKSKADDKISEVADKTTNDFYYWEIAKEILNEEDFELLQLKLVYGYTQKEIAKIKSIPKSTICFRYNKALALLKNKFEEGKNEK